MFFNWISRCWGGMGVNTKFEKARVNCSIADWTAPYQHDIDVLLQSFKGQNPQIVSQNALNMFFSHLQHDQQKSHPAFLLKYLYVLDHATEQMVGLDTIGYYYNSQLLFSKCAISVQGTMKDIVLVSSSPVRDLISGYYTYIKQKAKMYSQNETILCLNEKQEIEQQNQSQSQLKNYKSVQNKATSTKRSQFFKKCPNREIFKIMQKCISIQKIMQELNDKYKNGNKSVQLIKCIFTMLLKMYIYCYSIVSIGIKTLLGRFNEMDIADMQQFLKKLKFYNKDYTNNFITFVEINKQIQIFRSIKYTQFTLVSRQSIQIIKQFVEQKKVQYIQNKKEPAPGEMPSKAKTLSLIPLEQQSNVNQLQIPPEVFQKLKMELKIQYRHRNPTLNFQQVAKSTKNTQQEKNESFMDYNNGYSQDFSVQNDLQSPVKVNNNNSASHSQQKDKTFKIDFIKQDQSSKDKFKSSMIDIKQQDKQMNTKMTKSAIILDTKQKQYNHDSDSKFSPQGWNKWQNVYAEKI